MMKKYFLPFFIIYLLLPVQLFAITPETLKKYPYQLLTNDYGILNEANLSILYVELFRLTLLKTE